MLEARRSFDTATAALSKTQQQLLDAQRELAEFGLGQKATAAAVGVGDVGGARVASEAAAAAVVRDAGAGLAALTTELTDVSVNPPGHSLNVHDGM